MKPLLIAAVIAAQIGLAPQPALAATIEDQGASQQRIGTFAGARFRMPIGGKDGGKPSLGLGIAGMAQSRTASGEVRTRLSEGVQFGYSADRKLGLTVAGKPLTTKAGLQGDEDQDDGDGISTAGWIGIAVGGLLVAGGIGLALFVDAMNDSSE